MPPRADDWSDSDDDDDLPGGGVETSVLLGVPDGPIDDVSDISDAAVSRIGGHPVRRLLLYLSIIIISTKAFLPSREPSFDSSQCKVCSSPMQLLLQIWCPFEDSPMDRALYVWACSRAACQKKDGSIRAWRGLRFNEKYAAKLEKKREREKAKAAAAAAQQAQKSAPKSNPFSISSSSSTTPNPFALGNQIFGTTPAAPAPNPEIPEEPEDDDGDSSGDESGSSSEKSLTVALASTTLEDSAWLAAPSYAPLYLSTTSEYLPPQPKPKIPANVQVVNPDEQDKNDPVWNNEAYENSLDVDNVFERFVKRVGYESEQCLRYELKGTPLPFAKDAIFDQLFPLPPPNSTTISKSAFTVTPPTKRTYTPSDVVPACQICKSPRTFECQLMPNLINILKQDKNSNGNSKMTDEERKKAVERELKGGADGMSWGTVMIFSCEKDCCLDENGKECWREEVVLVQWDT
ncbi:hypothetical protein NP233_g8705 [Leucocoprinus birnbaumii]|uniref:Programmed cell death protein 2 C-terminal domain-containing protein n=1 Tax=Leucocoprinus birnbaumii TaxID=56174 RepID=A0AAD5YMW0_9AGAR|nr:hypothetical protein NP233_g8705 [Leucocoprinus birnbaumii]